MLNKSIIKHITHGALTKNNMGFYILLGSHHTYYIYNEQKYAHACIYESFNLPLWDSIKDCIMSNYIYELKMKVRDYECDLQGIVNNANYQHYIEHTRHEFLASTGISFAGLHEQGIDPVVARLNMAFKAPLKSGDEFVSKLYLKKEGIKYVFYQDIFRLPDMKVVIKSTVETVCVVNGRLGNSDVFDSVFAPYLTE